MPQIPNSPPGTPDDGTPSVPDRAHFVSPSELPPDSTLVLRVMPMPADTNMSGGVFGGWIMAQVDIAGAVLPARVSRGRVTTVAVNRFIFKQPVSVGDLLSFYARVDRIGTTSITVHVEVYAERNPSNPYIVKVTDANLTYVAIDSQGRPRPVPRD
ncbi:MAG: acyl-CoA thioesterase [Rhizobacter sp.]|jgi:acyl-CoA thioesterase YciA|nr:acyl-CoA thioesterase [Rhizobacter sp.]MBP6268450.1 acyl-CoA thioesterase [Rhizobacter sp.]